MSHRISNLRLSTVAKGPASVAPKWRIHRRLSILWAAIKNLFTGKGVYLSSAISANVGKAGMHMGYWISTDDSKAWEHWAATFDGKKAQGFIGGASVLTEMLCHDDGYGCLACGRFLPADEDGVIMHDNVPHPEEMTFDEEERPQCAR